MSHRSKPWYVDVTKIVPLLIGLGTLTSWIVTSIVADAKSKEKVEAVSKQVEELKDSDETQDAKITKVDNNYALIQQSLGYISETLKEMKAKR